VCSILASAQGWGLPVFPPVDLLKMILYNPIKVLSKGDSEDEGHSKLHLISSVSLKFISVKI
jgi:hypothetical protein